MKCPGQDSRYWKQNAIFDVKCPHCGNEIEFFKDDPARKCPKCGHRFINPEMDFGCASYCEYAEQCLGTLPPELLAARGDLLKDRVAIEMKRYFKSDFKRIGHASRAARYAEQIGKNEENANLSVILCAAYLHDIGIHEAERKHGSTAAKFQEIEGPPIAKSILEKLGAKEDLIKEVCDIIGHHHHPHEEETINFKVLYDADLITNLEEEHKEGRTMNSEQFEEIIKKSFLTKAGEEKTREVLECNRS